jgi:hypothetical protein
MEGRAKIYSKTAVETETEAETEAEAETETETETDRDGNTKRERDHALEHSQLSIQDEVFLTVE